MADHASATLLGAQDRQRPQQAAEQLAHQGQGCLAQHLDGGETRKDAEAALDVFIETYSRKYEKAAECVAKVEQHDRTKTLRQRVAQVIDQRRTVRMVFFAEQSEHDFPQVRVGEAPDGGGDPRCAGFVGVEREHLTNNRQRIGGTVERLGDLPLAVTGDKQERADGIHDQNADMPRKPSSGKES